MSANVTIAPGRTVGRRWVRDAISYGLLPAILVAICAVVSHLEPRFISSRNVSNVLTQASYLVTLAAAQMIVLLVRGFDLSMGTALSAISVGLGLVMTSVLSAYPGALVPGIALGLATALLAGALLGALNGACVVLLAVNPFVVTLGTQGIAASFAATASGGFPVYGLPVELTNVFSRASLGGVPVPVLACAFVLLGLQLMLNLTTFGRGLQIVGSNPRAAMVAGLPTRKYTFAAYVLCSVIVAVVSILLTARTGSGEPNVGGGLMLQSIAAAVIGGVSLRGGRGNVYNCLLGGLLITVLSNAMDLLQVDSFLQMIVLGVIFIAAVLIERLSTWGERA